MVQFSVDKVSGNGNSVAVHVNISVVRQTHVEPTPRVLSIANMFGLGIDKTRHCVVVPPTLINLKSGELTLITGPSGSGKSSILIAIRNELVRQPDLFVIDFNQLPTLDEKPLVECLKQTGQDGVMIRNRSMKIAGNITKGINDIADTKDGNLKTTLRWLSLAGLNDAFVMLRRPKELSDGQHYRLKLAQMMAMAETVETDTKDHSPKLTVVFADEFAATLDRVTANIIARNLRRWLKRTKNPICVVVATSHDDLLEPLEPDVLIEKQFGSEINVLTKANNNSN